jgi:phospholipid/cholesterol/gamma-HCH transport system permease protein
MNLAFIGQFLKEVFTPPYEFKEFLSKAIKLVKVTIPLVSITGFIMAWSLRYSPTKAWR